MKAFIANRILENQQVIMEALRLSLLLHNGPYNSDCVNVSKQLTLTNAIEQTSKIRQAALEDEPMKFVTPKEPPVEGPTTEPWWHPCRVCGENYKTDGPTDRLICQKCYNKVCTPTPTNNG